MAISRDATAKTLANEKLTQQYKMLEFSEAEYRQILNSVDDMIYRIDGEGNQIYLNTKGREIEELEEGETVFAPMPQFIHPADFEWASQIFRQQFSSGGPVQIKIRIVGKRGRVTYVSHLARVILDDAGKFAGILGVGRDVTQQMLQEEALAIHAKQQATVANIGQRVLEGISLPTLM
jgi:PAS domain S-box-containing protein